MGAVQAHSQDRRRRQHLTGRMRAQAADQFEPDLEKPIGIWQAYVLFHGFALHFLIDFFTMFLVAALGDRQVAARPPFRPGAVVESRSPFAEHFESEHQNGGRHARSATSDHRLRPVHAGLFEGRGERVGLFQTTLGDEVGGWNIEAARHVAAAQPWARFRRRAGEAVGRARIEHLRRAVFERSTDIVDLGDETMIEPRGEMPRLAADRPVFERTSLGQPLRQAAVEDRHFTGAEGAQRPPDARSREKAGAVIDDEAHPVADSEPLHRLRKAQRIGQHMRQAARRVGNLVDVEKDRARDVPGEILGARVAAERRKIPGRIDDDEVGRADFVGKLCRGREVAFAGVGHDLPSEAMN